ncbi:lipopolysaccharide assembly protein LapA domain-containing protein [Fictibacillus enclensis]|uniref:LapA family protein n=1 Tax=Fictibacillus enclensis TaxID=1017270 RepID=UPI0025A29EC8|nr:lipopolysaccharide assembly protein LapA domain-containing protein [Fictibacillus enclensis]MDM5340648.1 lipopolysaccharide assembly protein LapA domain-containing protein [Fictibacillus enclensis]
MLIAVFAVVNGNDVEFNYIFGSVKWPLVLIISGSAAIGGRAVGLLGFIKIILLRKTVKRLERERAVSEEGTETPLKEEATNSRLPECMMSLSAFWARRGSFEFLLVIISFT